ncbi:hypothetical protein H0S68_25525 (plasmid) [Serratia sp. AXJ-M]|uniref:helix-turn-helix transcriptional regulator n=1 Tax=Serratia sp. AXJ-M TaxID=2754727 RepID=UPI00397BD44A
MLAKRIVPACRFVCVDGNINSLSEVICKLRPSHVFLVLDDCFDVIDFIRVISGAKKALVSKWHVFVSWCNSVGLPVLCEGLNVNVIDIRQSLTSLSRDMLKSFSISSFISESLKPYCSRPHLTVREHDTLYYLSMGLTLECAASLLACKKKVAQVYRARAMRKLQLRNQSELVQWLPLWRGW